MTRRRKPFQFRDPVKISFWIEKRDLETIRKWDFPLEELLLSGLNRQLSTMLEVLTGEDIRALISINNRKIVLEEYQIDRLRKTNEGLTLLFEEKENEIPELLQTHQGRGE